MHRAGMAHHQQRKGGCYGGRCEGRPISPVRYPSNKFAVRKKKEVVDINKINEEDDINFYMGL